MHEITGKSPLYVAVINLMRAKAQLMRVSQFHKKELVELGNLLRISDWQTSEDIIVAVRHLAEIRDGISSDGVDTSAGRLFLEQLIAELTTAAKMMPKAPQGKWVVEP